MWENNIKIFVDKCGKEYLDYYMEAFTSFVNILEDDIEKWANVLTFFYPNVVGEYFTKYFINLKYDVEQFLIKLEEKK